MLKKVRIAFIIVLICTQYSNLFAQIELQDTTPASKQEHFYDSLEYRASQRKLTGWIYDFLISPPRPYVDKKALALDYYSEAEGKIISKIEIKALDVFGPSFTDTSRTAKSWGSRAANTIHTKSNLKTIEKQLLFKVGDYVNGEVMYENERIIRQLPYIKDVKIVYEQDTVYSSFVKITVLTKDRFSFGVSGGVSGTESGDLEVYNRNIFGVGHELSMRFVGHLNRQPYLGIETYYKIKNIGGNFLDISLGYLNTYKNEGYAFKVEKPFYTQNIKWGYGMLSTRMYRTDRISNNDPVRVDEPLNMAFNSIWGGKSVNVTPQHENATYMVFSAGVNNWKYYEDPVVAEENEHFFANRTLYMASLTFSQRRYIQDQLIYSYGITEDIPEGIKNEFIYGYDANEFGDRHYLQFFTSNGNLLLSQKGYIFLSAGIGGYFKKRDFEEGQIQGNLDYISKLVSAGRKRVRTFVDVSYTLGIQRYDIEQLTLGRFDHIRGFSSRTAVGKQRLSLKLEHVVFLPRQFYKFNMAIFGFADMGIIGSNNALIFRQDYYSGIGLGLRLHNENLVFETFRLRLAFYPFHPDDMQFVGFVLSEQSKQRFISFEPTEPKPMRFE
ncbi:hypothetical protein [uncultured Draconibacterium sp.]|uniref:hypothetical protein n=1 Tax=uncultured Draconibacterium sp. TaxID=1573823 RepID=UPI003217A73C